MSGRIAQTDPKTITNIMKNVHIDLILEIDSDPAPDLMEEIIEGNIMIVPDPPEETIDILVEEVIVVAAATVETGIIVLVIEEIAERDMIATITAVIEMIIDIEIETDIEIGKEKEIEINIETEIIIEVEVLVVNNPERVDPEAMTEEIEIIRLQGLNIKASKLSSKIFLGL